MSEPLSQQRSRRVRTTARAPDEPERASTPPELLFDLAFAAISRAAVVQLGWLLRLALLAGWGGGPFLVLVPAELAVPFWAEPRASTTWHAHHIAERYGLFPIIVLGEGILGATVAVETAARVRLEVAVAASAALPVVCLVVLEIAAAPVTRQQAR
jgi:hypothetical protein